MIERHFIVLPSWTVMPTPTLIEINLVIRYTHIPAHIPSLIYTQGRTQGAQVPLGPTGSNFFVAQGDLGPWVQFFFFF